MRSWSLYQVTDCGSRLCGSSDSDGQFKGIDLHALLWGLVLEPF